MHCLICPTRPLIRDRNLLGIFIFGIQRERERGGGGNLREIRRGWFGLTPPKRRQFKYLISKNLAEIMWDVTYYVPFDS